MMVVTLSLVQKGQTSGCSGIVVPGGWDIDFDTKSQTSGRSTQWMQWNSGIW